MTRSFRFACSIVATWLLTAGLLINSASAQQSSELDAVKAADQALYAAFSARDINAMEKVWANTSDAQILGPRNKSFVAGWDNIKKGLEGLFATFPELNVSITEPRFVVVGTVAWVTGIEQAQRKDKAGTSSGGSNLVTNIFQKQDGRWLLVHHHSSLMPQ
jgi:uncharacterized protein (TIGR02246 family)